MNHRQRHMVYYFLPYFLNSAVEPPLRCNLLDADVPTPKWVSWMQWADEMGQEDSAGRSADALTDG